MTRSDDSPINSSGTESPKGPPDGLPSGLPDEQPPELPAEVPADPITDSAAAASSRIDASSEADQVPVAEPAAEWVAEVSEGVPSGEHDSAAMPPHMEAAYRRASRRAVITAVVLGVLVLAGAAYIGSAAIARRFEGARKLDRAQTLVERADVTILELDEVVRAEADPELADRAEEVVADVPAARDALKEATQLIDEAYDSVTEDEQRKSALLRDAAEARLAMLRPAEAILAANVKAGRALEPARRGWDFVLDAEKRSDEAVAEYNKLTKEGVNRSTLLSAQAESALKNARVFLSEAATAFPEAEFERYLVFVDGKLGLLAISKQSNAAWLAGKIPEANALIQQYNAAEQRVIELARTLPQTPGKAVADAYEDLVSTQTKEYYEAREAATEADAAIDRF